MCKIYVIYKTSPSLYVTSVASLVITKTIKELFEYQHILEFVVFYLL